jgi:hypothetical protein
MLGSVAQNSKWGGGETGTCEKAVLNFCETNKQVNVAERKGKGRRKHMTNNEWGGKQEERMLSRNKWEIYSTVTQNPARAEPNGYLPFVRLLWSNFFTYNK